MTETRREYNVIGYYPCWEPDKVSTVHFDVLTHVNYAFVIPTDTGHLLPLRNPHTARELIAAAHAHGVKAILVVGGWDYEGVLLEDTFVKATDTPQKRRQLAEELMAMCEEFHFDGIDVDWEYPRAGKASARQYEDLMLDLAQRLHSRGKLLTCAVFSGVDARGEILPDGEGQTEKALDACDFINIMAYDGGDGPDHSGFDFAVSCARYWKDQRKIPGEKLNLGLPFYGRPSWSTYGNLIKLDETASDRDSFLLGEQEVFYNGIPTIQRKTRYAMEHLGGVMIWEVTQDSRDPEKSLLRAIGAALGEAQP